MAWDKTAYSILMRSVKSLSASSWTGDSYEVSGFALAINLWAMSSVNVLGKSLGKPCETSSSSDPLCLHWDSTRTPTITEVLELEKINNWIYRDSLKRSTNLKLVGKVENLLGKEFKKLEDSFLAPVIKMGRRQKNMAFSRYLIHHLLLRRIDICKKGLWFSFGEQLMRFSLREFHLATGLPCVVDKDEDEAETSATKKKKDPWMNKNQTLNTLLKLLVEKSTELTTDQRLRLGATILVEGILMASNPVTSIPEERLLRARNFKEFCKYHWGNLAFDYLLKEVKSFTYKKLTENNQYVICGFIYPIQLWALSSVNQLGTFFGITDDEIQFPLCLHWTETKPLTIEEVNRFDQMEKVDVKCILGDPELHSDLVEDVDCEFGRVVDLFKRGYRLKRQDWLNGSIDIAVAEAEVDENNSVPGIDATDHEKIEFLTKKVVSLEERVKYLEGLLNIRGETVKVNGQNADYELDETELLQDYIDAKRKEIAKRNKNGVRPPREVDHQDEDDTDVEVNEEQPQEVEEQQEEDDTAVDVDVSDKESENPETNEDGEVNEDASEKPVKGTKKRGRGTKDGEVNEDASEKPVKGTKKRGRGTKGKKKGVTSPREVEDDAEVDAKETENPKTNEDGEVNEDASKKNVKGTKKRGRVTKGKKKGVTPPREVQQQVEDDAETNEDGEGNEDASKNHVKFTKKHGRRNKEHIVETPKSKKQKKQSEKDSAADVIGCVLEDLKKAD
ncbi:PREDICTED: uncharacterized protein LOC106323278 [Brassica oleracea var. oleracea]|uniref:uncharacterized protein LOC106323278 n=1 Tax=Brassica oleracea var. oleracea TaxID=109376 RepID=UPI0006A71BC9|nr:PREDICTED: uncharacterized protein LOC106323278 [Brassica oleracea var. oleracea]